MDKKYKKAHLFTLKGMGCDSPRELEECLKNMGIDTSKIYKVIIGYEPVWILETDSVSIEEKKNNG